MLDSTGFSAGWVHDLQLHRFSVLDAVKFVVIGKVG